MNRKSKLRQARQLAGMTQDELARAVGLFDKSTISKIEATGSARPSTILRIAKVLRYPPHVLFPHFPKPIDGLNEKRKR